MSGDGDDSKRPAAGGTGSALFRAWGGFVVRFRWPLLLLNLCLTAYLGYRSLDLRMDTSFRALEVSDSDAARALDALEDNFGRDGLFMLAVGGDVFSLPYLQRLRDLHAELQGISIELPSLGERQRRDTTGARVDLASSEASAGVAVAESATDSDGWGDFAGEDAGWGDEAGGSVVDELTSLINVRDPRWRGGALRVGGLLDDFPTDARALPALRDYVLSHRSMAGQLVSPAGDYSVLALRTAFMDPADSNRVYDEIRRITASHDGPGFRIQVAGGPSLAAEMKPLMLRDGATMNVLSVLLMALLLGLTFRHALGVFAPLLVVLEAALWTTGAMVVWGVDMTMVSIITPSFLICVGIGDAVHIQSVYRQALRDGMGNRPAVVHALEHTGMPVVFTTLTTCLGLLSFRFASLDAIANFGTFSAVGVFAALLHSLVLLPVLLSFHRGRRMGAGGTAHRFFRGLLRRCDALSAPVYLDGRRSHGRRNAVLVASAVAMVVVGIGIHRAEVKHDPMTWLPRDNPGRVATETFDAHISGGSSFALLIEAPPGQDLKDLALLRGLAKLERHLLDYRDPVHGAVVRSVAGLLDPVRETWGALHGRAPPDYKLPDSQRGVVDTFTMFENSSADRLRRLLTVDGRVALMVMRVTWLDGQAYRPLITHIEAGIARHVGGRAKLTLTGRGLQSVTSANAIVGDLLRSFAVALLVISALMALLLRDRRLALVALVPNLLPIFAVVGLMGYLGIGVDMSNLLIASIGIGIAVDDTIHFLHHFRDHHTRYHDVDAAIRHAFHHAGQAILNTSLVLMAGFLVFAAADLGNIRIFGALIALTVALALLTDLLLAPALLRLVYGGHPGDHRGSQGSQHSQPPVKLPSDELPGALEDV